jgi:hypothetical protein
VPKPNPQAGTRLIGRSHVKTPQKTAFLAQQNPTHLDGWCPKVNISTP